MFDCVYFDPQTGLQVFLVVVALLSVTVLLLGKPVYLYWLHRGGKGLRLRRVSMVERVMYELVTHVFSVNNVCAHFNVCLMSVRDMREFGV